jgi:ubiquinone/menaquinone biosynthesis C-methylase UbiE
MKPIPESLARLLYGYRASRVVLSAVELDLFSALRGGATAGQAARQTSSGRRGVDILLHALAALGLVQKRKDRFFNSSAARDFLAAGGASDHRLALEHHLDLWGRWSRLTDVVRTGKVKRRERKGPPRGFIDLMDQIGRARAPHLARALDLAGVRTILDAGGGSGVYSIALARKKPGLRVTLLDQPSVIPLTRKYVAQAGLTKRFRFRAGDMRTDSFGSGFDLVLVSSICHQFSPRENLALFKKARRCLNPGGRLVVQDFILRPDRTGPLFAAMFAVNMLVGTKEGNSYTADEYRGWMRKAGFRSISLTRLNVGSDVMQCFLETRARAG